VTAAFGAPAYASEGDRATRNGQLGAATVDGHFGPDLRRFVLMQHRQGQGQVTVERLTTQLRALGISIKVVERLRANIRSSCREAASCWDRIEPPEGYDGPDWH
jgi:hypothetical protein